MNLSISANCSLRERDSAFSQSDCVIFYVSKVQDIPNILTLSFRRPRKTGNSPGSSLSSTTLSKYSKPDTLLSEKTSVPQFPHQDSAISVTISMTKLKEKGERRQPWRKLFFVQIWVKFHRVHDLWSRFSRTEFVNVKWTSDAQAAL